MSQRSGSLRCPPVFTSTRRRRAGGSCAGLPSCRNFLRTARGRIRWMAWLATSTSSSKTVTRVIDTGIFPVPAEHGNYTDPELTGPLRTTQKPIEHHPAGGAQLHGQRRQPRALGEVEPATSASTPAKAWCCTTSPSTTATRLRPIINRASIAEMVVPYGDPSPIRSWQNYFDTGEYLVGQYANSLELGCDCLGEITYLTPVVADNFGNPREIRNAICMHEEDCRHPVEAHRQWTRASNDTRRNRRLVISFFTTVGNYDYGFYWYFYLDGTIEFEVKATGVVFTSAYPGGGSDYVSAARPGPRRAVPPAPVQRPPGHGRRRLRQPRSTRWTWCGVPIGRGQPARQRLHPQAHAAAPRETKAQREADDRNGRVWVVVQPGAAATGSASRRLQAASRGQPALLADETRPSHAAPRSPPSICGSPGTHADERYPAGDFVNLHTGRSRPACLRRRRPRRSTARTSCSGTPSGSPTSRGSRTGRSCPWTPRLHAQARTASSTATLSLTCPPARRRPPAAMATATPADTATAERQESRNDHDGGTGPVSRARPAPANLRGPDGRVLPRALVACGLGAPRRLARRSHDCSSRRLRPLYGPHLATQQNGSSPSGHRFGTGYGVPAYRLAARIGRRRSRPQRGTRRRRLWTRPALPNSCWSSAWNSRRRCSPRRSLPG